MSYEIKQDNKFKYIEEGEGEAVLAWLDSLTAGSFA